MREQEQLEWIKELPAEEIAAALTKDIALIYDACGIDVLISLWTNFPSITFYVSTQPLAQLKRLYIRKNFLGNNQKFLAAKLGVSGSFVYDCLKNKNGSMESDPTLWDNIDFGHKDNGQEGKK